MKLHHWTVKDSGGFEHEVTLKTSAWSGKHTLTVDGESSVIQPKLKPALLGLTEQPLTVGGRDCQLVIIGRKADLAVDGVYLTSGQPYVPYQSLPGWAWIFLVLCILMCLTGGALPMGIGLGSAIWCGRTSVSPHLSTAMKVLTCVGITVLAWIALFTTALVVALLFQ